MMDAQIIFYSLTSSDIVVWTACLAAYAKIGDSIASLDLFGLSIQQGINPDGVLYGSFLSTCIVGGLVIKGLKYIQFMEEECGIAGDVNHYKLMMDLFGGVGDLTSRKHVKHNI